MTIYKGNAASGKKYAQKSGGPPPPPPPVVVTTDDAALPLTQYETGVKCRESFSSDGTGGWRRGKRSVECERRFLRRVCVIAALLTVLAFSVCIGYFVRQRLRHSKPFIETIHVQFHEYRRHAGESGDPERSRIEGGFYEQVEIDWKTKRYEKLNVPPFIDVKRATIVHDFVSMWTAIVDRDNSHCFIVPLNQAITSPPDLFLEYIDKIRPGRYLPNAKVERQVYKVVTPPMDNLTEFGDIIATDCYYYDTYRLVKADEPVAMSKRFACRFSGDTYSLGGTGHPLLMLIVLDGCV